jgi:hypothetical protein
VDNHKGTGGRWVRRASRTTAHVDPSANVGDVVEMWLEKRREAGVGSNRIPIRDLGPSLDEVQRSLVVLALEWNIEGTVRRLDRWDPYVAAVKLGNDTPAGRSEEPCV